jgi:hypothetical protein
MDTAASNSTVEEKGNASRLDIKSADSSLKVTSNLFQTQRALCTIQRDEIDSPN